jgi:hypothetical protein
MALTILFFKKIAVDGQPVRKNRHRRALKAGQPWAMPAELPFQQTELGGGLRPEWVRLKLACLQQPQPCLDDIADIAYFQVFVNGRVKFEVASRQLEKRRRGAQAIFLQMNKRASQLNQTSVKRAVGAMPIRQPKFLQHIVRLEEESLVEAFKEPEIVGGQFPSLTAFNQRRNLRALFTHAKKDNVQGPKSKVQSPRPCELLFLSHT